MARVGLVARSKLRQLRIPSVLWRLAGFGMIKSVNTWMSTLNYRMVRYERQSDPADELFAGPVIFVFWHEYIPFPMYLRPHCRLAMLLSQHQDAEVLSHAARFAGLEVVRGSTHRGGTAALRELLDRGKGMNLAITPDGPRGPRRVLAQGAIYLSSRLQVPLVALGVGYDRPWRYRRAWDQFAIPRPFSRARAVLGPRIQIPADLERDQIESQRRRIEQHLNQLTSLAESWADGEINFPSSEILFRSPPRRPTPDANDLWGFDQEASGLPLAATAPPVFRS